MVVLAAVLFAGGKSISASRLLDITFEDEMLTSNGVGGPAESTPVPVQDELAIDLADVPVLTDWALSPQLVAYTFVGRQPEVYWSTYVVKAGDTPGQIAEYFGIKPETLLGGNEWLTKESSLMQTGVELRILPTDGVLHEVREGDTVESLASQYGVEADSIVDYGPNNLEFPYRLYSGSEILVPGAVREVFVWTAPKPPARTSRPATSSGSTVATSTVATSLAGTGNFVWPISGRRVTQYYWYGHQAVDVGIPVGNAVYASDSGTVTWAGWNVWGYGNLIVIDHGNGFVTYYAHLSGINVYPGQYVYQGNYIGATGNTGRSTGPHIHFEIRYNNVLLDPLAYVR